MAVTYSSIRRAGFAQRLLAFAVALSFVLQSFVLQTHLHALHGAGQPAIATAHVAPAGDVPAKGQTPCQFCLAVAHGGAFLLAPAPVVLPVRVWSAIASSVFVAWGNSGEAAHGWQSRAPPRR
jgi:hypothetical protein